MKKFLKIAAVMWVLTTAGMAEETKLTQWSGEVVGFDQQANIVSVYSREKQKTYRVWVHKATNFHRDGKDRARSATDLLMGDVVKVDGMQLDDGRVLGVSVIYPDPVAAVPANRTQLFPAAGSRLKTARPLIGANFAGQLNPATARLFIDGKEVTNLTAMDGKSVTFEPKAGLAAGRHQAHLVGEDNWGNVNQVWTFETMQQAQPKPAAPAPLTLNLSSPTNNGSVQKNFVVSGTTRPGATVDMQLTPRKKVLGGFLGVQGKTTQATTKADASGRFQFQVQSPFKSGAEMDIALTAKDGNERTSTTHMFVTQQ